MLLIFVKFVIDELIEDASFLSQLLSDEFGDVDNVYEAVEEDDDDEDEATMFKFVRSAFPSSLFSSFIINGSSLFKSLVEFKEFDDDDELEDEDDDDDDDENNCFRFLATENRFESFDFLLFKRRRFF